MLISTQVLVETPEGIDLHAEPAGMIVRSLAYILDLLIRVGVLFVLSIIFLFVFGGEAGFGFILISAFLLEWFYPVIFEVYFKGQTPGKKLLGIAVVHDDLTPVSWGSSVTRNLLRTADFFPSFYGLGLVCMSANKNFQRIGDIVAGTLVVYRHKSKVNDALPEGKPQPAPVSLERDDQIAIVEFTQRHRQLSEDRQQELAEILDPILPVESIHRVEYLQGVGRWLLGNR